jgi:acyl carrier protein
MQRVAGMRLEEFRALVTTQLLAQWPDKAAVIEALSSDDDLLGSGIVDSYGFIELCLAVEQRTGAVIDIAELEPEQFASIAALHQVVTACG